MKIGIPKEILSGENRVSATPETVRKYVADGMQVLVERGAGLGSHFLDEDYVSAGAKIIDDVEELYAQVDLILKVKEPMFNQTKNKHEIEMMKEGQYIITFLHPASPPNHSMVKLLAKQKVTGLTLDGIPRISRAQHMDALTSMSACAGYKGIIMAADSLSKFIPQLFTAVGMIKPANVLIIGTGVAGLQAIATAKRLGAVVYAADIRPDAVEQAKSLGAKIIDTNIPADKAIGEGGYAKSLSEELLNQERVALLEAVKEADIIFLSALVPGKVAPILITEDMVKQMKQGSVIVDVSIDQGGNCELTVPGEIVTRHGVIINGIKNLPGHIPNTSTTMFANNVYNLVKYLTKDGKINLDLNDEIVKGILVTYNGQIVHEGTLEAMNGK